MLLSNGTGTAAVPHVIKVAKVNSTSRRAVSILLPPYIAKAGRSAPVLHARSVGLVIHYRSRVSDDWEGPPSAQLVLGAVDWPMGREPRTLMISQKSSKEVAK